MTPTQLAMSSSIQSHHPSMTIPASLEMPTVPNGAMPYAPQQMLNPTDSVDWNALFKDEFVPPSWQEMGGVQFPFASI